MIGKLISFLFYLFILCVWGLVSPLKLSSVGWNLRHSRYQFISHSTPSHVFSFAEGEIFDDMKTLTLHCHSISVCVVINDWIELNWIGLKNICWLPWLVTPHIILTDRSNKCFSLRPRPRLGVRLKAVKCLHAVIIPAFQYKCRWIQPIPQHTHHTSYLWTITEPHSSELMCFKYIQHTTYAGTR